MSNGVEPDNSELLNDRLNQEAQDLLRKMKAADAMKLQTIEAYYLEEAKKAKQSHKILPIAGGSSSSSSSVRYDNDIDDDELSHVSGLSDDTDTSSLSHSRTGGEQINEEEGEAEAALMKKKKKKKKGHLDRLSDLADEVLIEVAESEENDNGINKSPQAYREGIGGDGGIVDLGGGSSKGGGLSRIPSFKFPTPTTATATNNNNSSSNDVDSLSGGVGVETMKKNASFRSPGKLGTAPSPPKGLPPVSSLSATATGSGTGTGGGTFDPGLRIMTVPVSPLVAATKGGGFSPKHVSVDSSPMSKNTTHLTPTNANGPGFASGNARPASQGRPMSRDDVRSMVIPPFSPKLTTREQERESRSRGTLRSQGGVQVPIIEESELPNLVGENRSGSGYGFAIYGKNNHERESDQNEGEFMGRDLSQHNFYGNSVNRQSIGGSQDNTHNIDKGLVASENMFTDRPGTHERPSSTQTKYLSLYANDNIRSSALRIQTPKAVLLAQEEGFALDTYTELELSHRSVDSQLTDVDGFMDQFPSKNNKRNVAFASSSSSNSNGRQAGIDINIKKNTNQTAQEQHALPFPFNGTKPILPHVDTHVTNPAMNYEQIKSKYMTPEDILHMEKKIKFLRKRKELQLKNRKAMRKKMLAVHAEESLMSEFTQTQIDNAMLYFRQTCVGLSNQKKETGKISRYETRDLYSTSNLDMVSDEIKLNELEAVIRKFRRAQVTQEEEEYGRDLLISLEWLLDQLNMSPMEWFTLADSTRLSQVQLSDDTSARVTGTLSGQRTYTKGNGKLSYLELVVGIDLLCEKLSEKFTIAANVNDSLLDTAVATIRGTVEAEKRSRSNSKDSQDSSPHGAASAMKGQKGNASPLLGLLEGGLGSSSPTLRRSANGSPVTIQGNNINTNTNSSNNNNKKAVYQRGVPRVPEINVIVPLWKRSDIQTLLRYLDPNSDGDISTEELQLAFRNLHSTAQSVQLMQEAGPIILRLVDYLHANHLKVKDLFRLIDADRSNTISSKELFQALMRMPKAGTGIEHNDDDSMSVISMGSMTSMGSMSTSLRSLNSQNGKGGEGSIAGSVSTDMTSITNTTGSSTSYFKSPFKYQPGSRAIRGAKAFGRQHKSVMEIKMYDLNKLNQREEARIEKSIKHRDRDRSLSPTNNVSTLKGTGIGVTTFVDTMSVSQSLSMTMTNSKSRINGNSFGIISKQDANSSGSMRSPNTTGIRNSFQSIGQNIGHSTSIGMKQGGGTDSKKNSPSNDNSKRNSDINSNGDMQRKILLDPLHNRKLKHYNSVWDRQIKQLDFGK